jgi:hypothetical protein
MIVGKGIVVQHRRVLLAVLLSVVALVSVFSPLSALSPAPKHYVFFNRERGRIAEASFLETPGIAGAQLKYTWRELEPARDKYNIDLILRDLAYLEQRGKRLFIQVQDVTFSGDAAVNVPAYLTSGGAFHGGVARTYDLQGDDDLSAKPAGWVARRWDPAVRARFVALLNALGRALDGRIEGINLPETALDFGASTRLHPQGFTYESYLDAVKQTMSAARAAFPTSKVIQYANFMPGEWLPNDDRGFLRDVYAHANRIGVGVGGPDLLPNRRGQLNHSYALIPARAAGVVAGIAVQDGNLAETNGATGRQVTVAELYAFALDRLKLDYIFWGTEEPYYSRDVLPFLRARQGGPLRSAR